ncbi:hypothetical protein JCM19238_429 [Vibrio ponticus]|nr:hypothetical protein JCM19238_429 [Vibrio ponticus]
MLLPLISTALAILPPDCHLLATNLNLAQSDIIFCSLLRLWLST